MRQYNDPVLKNIKEDENSFQNILTYYIGYRTSYGIKPLHIVFLRVNGYIEDDSDDEDENKHLTQILVNKENEDMLKNIKKYGIKKYLINLSDNNANACYNNK